MRTTWDEPKTLEIGVALEWVPGEIGAVRYYDYSRDEPLPLKVWEALGEHLCEGSIHINYRVKGYYDPGQMCGPPERCYPPEGDNEVLLDGVEMQSDDGRTRVRLPRDKGQVVLDEYMDLICGLEDIRA